MGDDRMIEKRYVARSTAIAARALGNELMIMSSTNSTLFTLNEIAMVIWEAADGTTPLEVIVTSRICERYAVTPEVAMKDAENLVDELAGHGLLLVSGEPIAPTASSVRELA
jgi:hypothetical protein